MKPVLFNIFGITVYGYGTMIAIGIIAAILLFDYRVKKRGYDEDSMLNMAILAIIGGIVGGKLLYIITEFGAIVREPSILKDFGSGFVIYGSILGGILGVYLYSRRKKWDVFKVFDLGVPSLPLAQGFGRIGCYLAGCCYGKVTSLSIGVTFKEGSLGPSDVSVHPTQIYSSVFDFLLAIFLLWYDRKERKKGRVFSLYLIVYSIGRFCIEFIRNDPRGSVGPLSTSQFVSIFTLLIGTIFFNFERIKALMHKQDEITKAE